MGAPLHAQAAAERELRTALDLAARDEAPEAPGTAAAAVNGRILERIARGAPLEEILDHLVRELEHDDPSLVASIMLLGDSGTRLSVASAPSLPPDFCRLIDGALIGPEVGSCGTAAYWGERVVVSDIAASPLWVDYRDAALAAGLRACWSEPINATNGEVLGTMAVYYRTVQEPGARELQRIAEAAQLASIAIERRRSDERIARLTNLYRARSEISQFLVQTPAEDALLSAVCRVAVDFGGMRMAWIGYPDHEGKRLVPLARYGTGLAYLESIIIAPSADVAEGHGPAGRTFRTGECTIINDFANHPSTGPWRKAAARHEFRAVGCFPIPRGGATFAVLGVYSGRKDSFDSEAIALLCQIGKDIGFALDAIDHAQAHAAAVAQLRDSEQHFRAYFDRSMVGMAATGAHRRWIEVNDTLCQMLGYTRDELLERTWADVTHPDDLAVSEATWERFVDGGLEEYEGEKRYLHKDGHTVHTRIAARAVRTPQGQVDYIVLIVKDTSERLRAAQALDEKDAFLDSILRSEPECVAVIGRDGDLLQINAAGLKLFGCHDLAEIQSAGVLAYVLSRYRRAFLDLHKRACEGGRGVLEFQVRGGDGALRWLEMHASPLRDKSAKPGNMLCIARDITDRKRSADLIWKQANFDLLTGLPNRYMFQDRLSQEIKKARRSRTLLGLLFIDLDFFKEVNDSLGHETGDALLVAVAQRINTCVRDSDTIARLGGDEFTVILPQLADTAAAERIALGIITRLGEVFSVRGETINLSASIGITYFPNDADSVDGLLKNADQAMYVAKRQGRNRVGFFTATLQEAAQNRLRLVNDLRGALDAGEFRLYFQPIVDLATQRFCGAEALLRWQHPKRGLVSPAEFIPLAEDTGLIIRIGDWAFREAARWAQRWAGRTGGGFSVSVNNSPVQFRQPELLLAWPAYLESLGLPGGNMTIEITEGLLLDADDSTSQVLARLRASGLHIAIDDFGTGYSSLSYLHRFALDALKIDQSFVRDLDTKPSARALSESIIVMGHKLGLTVVAEGVETAAQRDFLRAAGCDFAQGYLYSRPVPAEAFEALLYANLAAPDELPDMDW